MLQDEHVWQAVLLRQAYYLRAVSGDYEAAVGVIQEVVARATAHSDQATETKAYHAWGRILSQQGTRRAALGPLEHALRLARATDSGEKQRAYMILGWFIRRVEDTNLATTYYRVDNRYQSLGQQQGEINCLLMFGVITNEQGDYPAALLHYRQAIARAVARWRHAEAYSLTNLGNNYFDFGDYEAAFTCHQRALEICREIC